MRRFKDASEMYSCWVIILAIYNHFHNISLSCPPVHEINMIFNVKVWDWSGGAGDIEF